MQQNQVLIGHGSGGRLSRELVKELFIKHFDNPALKEQSDSAILELNSDKLAFTTDSYVIDPIFFPGGNIGNLAVSGTVNDLCVSGATPKYLSCGFIIEEGFPIQDLEKIVESMANEAKLAGVAIVTGDTKVVKRGQADKLFINTSGIGILPAGTEHLNQQKNIESGDKIIVSGNLGDHAMAVLSAREKLQLDEPILSDVAPLNELCSKALKNPDSIKSMRDITRGGLATVLVEICEGSNFGISIYEKKLPVKQSVRSICDLYGFDPLYLANEGKIMFVIRGGNEEEILECLKTDQHGCNAVIVGEVVKNHPGKVSMRSSIGGTRMIDMLSGEMLPRIC